MNCKDTLFEGVFISWNCWAKKIRRLYINCNCRDIYFSFLGDGLLVGNVGTTVLGGGLPIRIGRAINLGERP